MISLAPRSRFFGRALVSLVMVGLLAPGLGGCRQLRRRFRRHASSARSVSAPRGAHGARIIQTRGEVEQLAVAAARGTTLVLAVAGATVQVARLDEARTRSLGRGQTGSDRESDLAVAPTETGFVATWRRTHGERGEHVLARLRDDGSLEGAEQVEALDEPRAGSAIAVTHDAIATADVTAGAVEIRIYRPDGTPTGTPLLLPGSADGSGPALVASGNDFVAAFTRPVGQHSELTLARVDPSARTLRLASALQRTRAEVTATLAALGNRTVMAWTEAGPADGALEGPGPGGYATAFEASGERVSEPQSLATAAWVGIPTLAAAGESVGAAWFEAEGTGARLRIVRLDGGGAPSGTARDLAHVAASAPARLVRPALAWDGRSLVLARAVRGRNVVQIDRVE